MADSDFRAYTDWVWSMEPGRDVVEDFLLHALQRARRYDRQAGFFSSSSLLVSGRGVDHLLGTVPRQEWPAYRLVVCEQLSEDDAEAITAGEHMRRLEERLTPPMLRALEDPGDAASQDRLALLAAMVAVGFAEIRVVVPCDARRRPKAGAIEHAKAAILYDRNGNTVVAFGSANESWQGWVHNNEQMDLYASWEEPAWKRYGLPKVQRFDRLWEGRDPLALTVDLPRAVRERLVSFAPDHLPAELQPPQPAMPADLLTLEQEAAVLQFLRDAPYLPGGRYVGMTTAAVSPWPHHVGIVETATRTDAPRFLFCDEVGLGKTAEAAFSIRQLRLQGQARRVLILAPRNLCEQWQDELLAKFGLAAARYDGAEMILPDLGDGHGRVRQQVGRREVFEGEDALLIVSAELARRQDRRDALLQAPPWDLVVVDEAHHARREGFDREDRGPNRLLDLLRHLERRTRGLLLLTATPMQIDPREVWDLLRLIGLSGAFQHGYSWFKAYYSYLARLEDQPPPRAALDGLFGLIDTGAAASPDLLAAIEARDPLFFRRCKAAVETSVAREQLTRVSRGQQALLREFFLAYAPTRQRMFRTTRERLRAYHRQGLLSAVVPQRHVVVERIPFDLEEDRVYHKVEDYLSQHYQNAQEGGQRGLGFVLTCYRRRMGSSAYALRCSLERLHDRLRAGRARAQDLLDEDDLQNEADLSSEDAEQDAAAAVAPDALADLEDLLHDVRALRADTKLGRLQELLDEIGRSYSRVIIFTQYTDTMDHVREHLLARTDRIGCYSGRGGEVYDGDTRLFVQVSKTELQERFRRDDGPRYLVCTEAAAEGLNLQACGAMVNYDMPWNPMRVEQRIGRIDRIGQTHQVVRVHNLFSTPSVEDDVYGALEDRIGQFEHFVGPLQPILMTMEHVIRALAMTAPSERESARARAVNSLQREADDLRREAPAMPVAEGFARPVETSAVPQGPVALADLKQFCLRSPTLLDQGALRDVGEGVYELRWQERLHRITFDGEVAESRVKDAALFTYGHPIFDMWMNSSSVEAPDAALRLRRSRASGRVSYWHGPQHLSTLGELLKAFETP